MTVNKPEILRVLQETYPEAKAELHFSNPYEMLVSTMLSAQCTDKQVNKVTPAVFRDFPNPRAMAATTAEVLYPYIKSCGFKTKAANIVAACQIITEKYNGEVPADMDALTSLPGVGRKTANVVLSNAFHIPPSRWIRTFSASATGWVWRRPITCWIPKSSCSAPSRARIGAPRITG